MEIKIFSVGKIHQDYLRQGINDFYKRIQHYLPIEWIIIKEEKISAKKNKQTILQVEAQRIKEKAALHKVNFLVALDKSGRQFSSEGLAKFLTEKMHQNIKIMAFIVGGPLGLDPSILEMAQLRLSLSEMTFLHEISLFILCEQLYRSFTIMRGEKYHK